VILLWAQPVVGLRPTTGLAPGINSFIHAGGAATLTTLIQGFSVELATLLVAAIISSYTFMGGLGAFFYMSYFNSAAILIFIVVFLVKVFYDNSPTGGTNVLGLAM